MSDKQDNKSSTENTNKGVELEIDSTQSEQKTAPKKQVRKRKPRQKTNPDDKAKTDASQNIEKGNSEEEKDNETEEDEELLDFKLEINKYIYQLIKREMRMIGLRTIKECLKNVKDKDKYKDKDLDEIEKQLVEKLSDFIPQ